MKLVWLSGALLLAPVTVLAQTYQRLGGCPTLGCVFPPDQYARPLLIQEGLAN